MRKSEPFQATDPNKSDELSQALEGLGVKTGPLCFAQLIPSVEVARPMAVLVVVPPSYHILNVVPS
jgi:hypothetical protein